MRHFCTREYTPDMDTHVADTEKPNIFNYSCYRQFLKDFYDHKKKSRTTFSHRRFAQLADIKSSNYLYLVMNNKRNLSLNMAARVAKAMSLSNDESQHFVKLVAQEPKTPKSPKSQQTQGSGSPDSQGTNPTELSVTQTNLPLLES